MFTLICGSPKAKNSNSMYFLNKINKNLNNYNIFELKASNVEDIILSIKNSDAIVLAFPLYVDSPSSITLELLDYIFDNNISMENKIIYSIINCGFREGKQNIAACEIIKRWCYKVGATYGCSIMIGAGEIVGKQKFKFISNRALKDLNKFSSAVNKKQTHSDIITTMDLFNNKMYCFVANLSWKKKGKKNNLLDLDIRSK